MHPNKELYDFVEQALVQKKNIKIMQYYFNNFLYEVNVEKRNNKNNELKKNTITFATRF